MGKGKTLANVLTGVTLLGATLLPSFGNSQNINKYVEKEKAIVSTEYNSSGKGDSSRGTDEFYGDQYLNPFVQPNLLNEGNFDLNYYGSGDVTGDNQIDWSDYNSILGSNADEADVNGDGYKGTQADKDGLFMKLIDQIPILPAHWEFQNTSGKEAWFENYYNNVDVTDQIPPGDDWDCDQYSMQYQINSSGVENIAGSGLPGIYDFSNNAQGNMPVYQVSTISGNDIAHTINAILVGEDPTDFNSWYFYEPQNDTRVFPGSESMDEDSFAHVKKYAYFWNGVLEQYIYGMNNVVKFDLNNGNASIDWQHPDLVTSRPIEQSYVHIGGEIPGDVDVEYGEETNTGVTGEPSVPDWATAYYSDESTQGTGDWNPATYNYEILRSWWAKSDFSSLIDTTYGSTNPVYGRDPQTITVEDNTPPWFTYVHGDQEMLFSEYIQANQSTGDDNSGVYAISRSVNSDRGTNPANCDFYQFNDIYTDEIVDPSSNTADTTFTFSVNLDPNQWNNVPGEANVNYGDDISPDALGWATALNPAGVDVEVTYEDESTQGDPGTCEYIQYEITRTWTATDAVCGTSIDTTQTIYVTPEENVWDFFPNDWQGQYSQNLSLEPSNTGGAAQASNPGGLEVTVTSEDDSNRSTNPLNCTYYNFWVDRTWTATEDFCDTYIQDVQELTVTKPMSLAYTSFPEDYEGDIIDPWDPSVAGEPTGEDTLAPVIPVEYIYEDQLVESTSTYDKYHRVFELTENVCGTETDSDSTQVITLYKETGVNSNSLEDQVKIYPNPTSGVVYIKSELHLNYIVYSAYGHGVIKGNRNQLDISGLSAGVYEVLIFLPNQQLIRHRLIKR